MGPGDDRLSRFRTIMGLAGLTAVFGMGTGVAPPAWSPGIRPAGGEARRASDSGVRHDSDAIRWDERIALSGATRRFRVDRTGTRIVRGSLLRRPAIGHASRASRLRGTDRGGQAARLLGPVG